MLARGQVSRASAQAPNLLHRHKEFPGSIGAKELPVTVQSCYQPWLIQLKPSEERCKVKHYPRAKAAGKRGWWEGLAFAHTLLPAAGGALIPSESR